ncbi:MAG: saccharopine dehydrogenase NADP-binding domain-containing protein, partial [Rhodothermales bacterium]|nr:saccharopine dehydrogenase NADP-binding domain-containing protein [Rhodothermales bacterium]
MKTQPVVLPTSNMRFLVLGGYGNTGRRVCRLLLQATASDVLVAGRNYARAAALCTTLTREFGRDRARPVEVDAADEPSLAHACEDADMVVVASSTGRYADRVARAALQSGTDYMDVIFSSRKTGVLRSLEGEIRESGRCFITDGGFHPGLPAAVVRWLARDFHHVESATVASVVRAEWQDLQLSRSTVEEFVEEFADMPIVEYRNGEWSKAGVRSLLRSRSIDFGAPFGRQACVPMFLEEMVAVTTEFPDMSDCGF